jgi:hypothetical protein
MSDVLFVEKEEEKEVAGYPTRQRQRHQSTTFSPRRPPFSFPVEQDFFLLSFLCTETWQS